MRIYALFSGLHNVAVYQNGQIRSSGMQTLWGTFLGSILPFPVKRSIWTWQFITKHVPQNFQNKSRKCLYDRWPWKKKGHDPFGQAPPPPPKTATAQITNFHIVQDVTGCQYSSSKNIHGFFLLKSFAIQAITFQAWVLEGYENYLIHGYCRIGLIEWFEITKALWDQQSDLKFQLTMGSAVWFWK